MTPLDFAQNLARSDEPKDKALAVGIIARGLSDGDGLRAGWPIITSVMAAIPYLGLTATDELVRDALTLAPTISDAMLNKGSDTNEHNPAN